MPHTTLATARAEALFASTIATGADINLDQADAAIRHSIRVHHVAGCAILVAGEYGEHPELAVPRMRWAVDTVAKLYPPRPRRAAELVGAGR